MSDPLSGAADSRASIAAAGDGAAERLERARSLRAELDRLRVGDERAGVSVVVDAHGVLVALRIDETAARRPDRAAGMVLEAVGGCLSRLPGAVAEVAERVLADPVLADELAAQARGRAEAWRLARCSTGDARGGDDRLTQAAGVLR